MQSRKDTKIETFENLLLCVFAALRDTNFWGLRHNAAVGVIGAQSIFAPKRRNEKAGPFQIRLLPPVAIGNKPNS